MNKIVRKHIYFSGQVQAVGFRYFALHYAEELGLTGYVKNLYDERVEMEVQGTELKIEEMISRLDKTPSIWMTKIESTDIPVIEEKGFNVKY